MASFINPDYLVEHQGLARLQAAMAAIRRAGIAFAGARGLVALLSAGAVSALLVVADQIVSTWADGHILLAWVVLWALVFAAVALFAEAARGWSDRLVSKLQARSQATERRLADERVWALAQSDPRFMADIQAARLRAEREALDAGEPQPDWPFANLPHHGVAQAKFF